MRPMHTASSHGVAVSDGVGHGVVVEPGGVQRALPRITMLCVRYWPDQHGGVEQRVWQVSRAFARQGAVVNVITENRAGAAARQTIQPGLTVRRLDPMDPGQLWRWRELPRVRWWQRVVRRWARPGVIWATDPLMAMGAVLAGRGGDLVFNPAGCVAAMRHIGKVYPHVTTMQRPRRLAWVDQWMWRLAHMVVVSSDNVKSQYERFCRGRRNGRVHVVSHGVQMPQAKADAEAARARWGLPRDGLVIGFVGRLDPCKGLDFLFHAVAKARLARNDRLLIVGDGPDRARLQALAQRTGVASRIIWAGAMPDPAQAYAAMGVLVLPSVYEAFGNVFLEAMSHGLAVIGRRGDGRSVLTASQQIIQHGHDGFCVGSHDVHELAQKLRLLSSSPSLRRAMGAHAKATAFGLPWDNVVQHYTALLVNHPASLKRITTHDSASYFQKHAS